MADEGTVLIRLFVHQVLTSTASINQSFVQIRKGERECSREYLITMAQCEAHHSPSIVYRKAGSAPLSKNTPLREIQCLQIPNGDFKHLTKKRFKDISCKRRWPLAACEDVTDIVRLISSDRIQLQTHSHVH